MDNDAPSLTDWRQIEVSPPLGAVLLLSSWSLLPLGFSFLMLGFGKYEEYIFFACLSTILMQSISLAMVIGTRQISLKYHSIRKGVTIVSIIAITWIFVYFSQIEYSNFLQVCLTILHSYFAVRTLQIFSINSGSMFETACDAQEPLSKLDLSGWDVESYLFNSILMAKRQIEETNGVAWIYGVMEGEQVKLVLDIFGHNPQQIFDISLLGCELQSER